MPRLNFIQFTCHTIEEGGRTLHFEVKRRKLDKFQQMGAKFISGFVTEQGIPPDQGAAAAMRSIRVLLDPADFPAELVDPVLERMAVKHRESPTFDTEAQEALDRAHTERLNGTRGGTTIAALTVWYCLFRHQTGYLKHHPKQWQSMHVYYLDGDNPSAPLWPLIKVKSMPYELYKEKPEFELPALDRINVWMSP